MKTERGVSGRSVWLELAVGGQDDSKLSEEMTSHIHSLPLPIILVKPMIWRVSDQGVMESALSAAYRQCRSTLVLAIRTVNLHLFPLRIEVGGPILQTYTRSIDHILTLFFMYGTMPASTRSKFAPVVSANFLNVLP